MSILPEFSLDKRIAIVTGGYGHLGKSMCWSLAEAGATVIVCGKDRKKYDKAFNQSEYKKIHFQKIDISSIDSIKRAFKEIRRKHRKIDILINNAFYLKGGLPGKITNEQWNYGIDGTLSSVFRCIEEVIPYMKENKKGSIVNIVSMYGIVSPDFRVYENDTDLLNPPNYGAAKAGIIQLTKYYAVYFAKDNVRVNCISPGAFPSYDIKKRQNFIKKLSDRIPMGRIGNPEELGGAVVFLSSEASSYVTGQNLVVDGGWTAW